MGAERMRDAAGREHGKDAALTDTRGWRRTDGRSGARRGQFQGQ